MRKNELKEPVLFRMVRRGYDPEEVLDCFLSIIDIIRSFQTRLQRERDKVYQEFLLAKATAEEEKKCVTELEKELLEARQEIKRLRILYGLDHDGAERVSGCGAGAESASHCRPREEV